MVDGMNSVFEADSEDFAAMLAQHEASAKRLQPGQQVVGKIIEITPDSVFVDIGVKLDGIMEKKDILNSDGAEAYSAGDTIEAWVIGISPQEIRLARSMSGSGIAALENAQEAAVPVDGRVTAVCKGGYSVEVLGKTAFCPGSQMLHVAGDDANAVVGRTLQFLVTRIENHGRNIVVSHRALQDREREKNIGALLENLKVGDTIEGRVTRLAPFGAFIELAPAVEGMIHISELSWSRVGAADEVLSLGDVIRAKVLSIDKKETGQVRIALSRKQAEGDPWENISDKLQPGAIVSGKVTRLAPFGAFVEILPGVEGLVHLSEMSWDKRITKPETVLAAGDAVSVKIKEISPESRRISLSLREAEGDPWQDVSQTFAVGTTVSGVVESQSSFGVFVNLAPGITGLLPMSVLKKIKSSKQYSTLHQGDAVTLVIQSVDPVARRIGLVPEGEDISPAADEDTSWRQHTKLAASTVGSGLMAQALQKAMSQK